MEAAIDPIEMLNNDGRRYYEELERVAPRHACIVGEPGMGKSMLAKALAVKRSGPMAAINASPRMRVDHLVGYPVVSPNENGGGISVRYEDGILTQMIRAGGTFLFEELTRAPQEMLSRLYGLLDGDLPYWSIPEVGDANIPIHSDFWIIATANPQGNRLYTQQLDRALERRFDYIVHCDKPMADEVKVLTHITGSEPAAEQLYKWVSDARGAEININTGDLVKVARNIMVGFSPWRAVEVTVGSKYPDHARKLQDLCKLHMGLPADSPTDAWGGVKLIDDVRIQR